MLSSILGIIYFIIAISIIVIVHEWGHMVVAKRNGVKCFEFSVGMGPKLITLGTDKYGTVYNIRAIPLGGYVAMAGEEESEGMEFNPDESLMNKKPWQKIKILFAGAGMNFVLGFVVLFLTAFFIGITVPDDTTIVNVSPDSPAQAAGLETGDSILTINGAQVSNFNQIEEQLNAADKFTIEYTDSKTNKTESTDVTKQMINCDSGVIGISPNTVKDRFDLIGSLKQMWTGFWAIFGSVGQSLQMLASGTAGVGDLMGPVGIASASKNVVTGGLYAMLMTIAFLSINIGIVNLLPIPALDGGRMVLAFYELITRRRVPEKLELYLNLIGFIALMGLFVVVTFSDVGRLGTADYYDMQVNSDKVCARTDEPIDYHIALDQTGDEKAESLSLNLFVSDGQITSVDGQTVNSNRFETELTADQYKTITTEGIDVVVAPDSKAKAPLDMSIKINDEKGDAINQAIYRIER